MDGWMESKAHKIVAYREWALRAQEVLIVIRQIEMFQSNSIKSGDQRARWTR